MQKTLLNGLPGEQVVGTYQPKQIMRTSILKSSMMHSLLPSGEISLCLALDGNVAICRYYALFL